MDGNLAEFKRKLLDTGLFHKVSGQGQYRCQTCPYCGDTHKHMYVKIDTESDTPVLYKCFKCNASGFMKQDWLDFFGIQDIKVPKSKGLRKIQSNGVSSETIELIDFDKDVGIIESFSNYIHKRVGVIPSKDDLIAFQCIGNVFDYVTAYLGGDMKGLRNRLWFRLSNGNIVGRITEDDGNTMRWKKRNRISSYGVPSSGGIYIIKNFVNTQQTINICICEGVMDAIGLYYHSGVSNAVYIATMGMDYMAGVKYALNMGIFGNSVKVRVFKDSDIEFVRIPYQYKQLYRSITIYKNAIGKDFGVSADKIEIERVN